MAVSVAAGILASNCISFAAPSVRYNQREGYLRKLLCWISVLASLAVGNGKSETVVGVGTAGYAVSRASGCFSKNFAPSPECPSQDAVSHGALTNTSLEPHHRDHMIDPRGCGYVIIPL